MSKRDKVRFIIVPIIVAIIGATGVIIAHYVGGPREEKISPTPLAEEIISPSAVVRITSHRERDSVEREIVVSGEYANVPKDEDIWLYVFAPGIQRYYFHRVDVFSDDTWESSRARSNRVIVGSTHPDDVGVGFRIGVLLASDLAMTYGGGQLTESPYQVGQR